MLLGQPRTPFARRTMTTLIRPTAHLALIAYVVGGWLLPATHHHSGSCAAHAHGTVAPEADTAPDSDSHGHSAGQRHACDHDHAAEPADTQQCEASSLPAWKSLTHDHLCVGLCALCAARTLSPVRSSTQTIASQPVHRLRTKLVEGPLWPMPGHDSSQYSRGPPNANV